jgi:hypothetical protein
VLPASVVEAERAPEGLEDLVRRGAVASLFEAEVVLLADAGEPGDLVAAEPGDTAPRQRPDADVLGAGGSAACTEVLAEW